jgi:MFS family permease
VVSQALGWRWIFWVLAIMGGALLIVHFLFLNETLRSLVGNGSGYANPTPFQWWKRRRDLRRSGSQEEAVQVVVAQNKRKSPNPLQSLLYLREKDVAILVLYYAFQYGAMYCFTTSVPTLFSEIYDLNDLQIGLTYLANGFGSVVGSVVQGKLLDRDFRILAIKHGMDPAQVKGGKLTPEFPLEYARLRLAWIHVLVFNGKFVKLNLTNIVFYTHQMLQLSLLHMAGVSMSKLILQSFLYFTLSVSSTFACEFQNSNHV